MKKLLAVALFVFAAVLNSFPASTNQPPTSAEQLRSELEAALEAKDTNAVLSLFNWDGVSNKTNGYGYAHILVNGLSGFFIKHPTNSIQPRVYFQPLPENFDTEEIINGFRYAPNVSVKGLIQFSVSAANNVESPIWQIPYGETNGCFYLAGTIVEKIYEPKTRERLFVLNVSCGVINDDPPNFTGEFTYLQNGAEIKKFIRGKGTARKIFFGDVLKSCFVTNSIVGTNLLKLEIWVDGKNLFDPEIVETNGLISYERKN